MSWRRIITSITFTILWLASISSPVIPTQGAGLSSQTHPAIETGIAAARPSPQFAPGVVLAGLKPGVAVDLTAHGIATSDLSLTDTFTRIGVREIEPVFHQVGSSLLAAGGASSGADLSRIYRLRLPPEADVLQSVRELNASSAVEYAEPDYLAHIITTPNDPEYPSQWGLLKINMPAAWDVVTGGPGMDIAIVDAGIDVTHPDLTGQLWQNPGEIAGNGIDDDNDGYVDDVHGWNLVNQNADLSDNTGHGTEVAGVIAAATDNGVGIAGMCWQCRLMIVKVVQLGGVANYSDIAAGVAYAAQKGAKVINLSLGGSSDSITLKTAIANAAQTALIVAGAGNDNSSAPFYPASYDDYVLATAGTAQTDARVGTSNYGSWVDVSAPGDVIRTTHSGGGYVDSSGTSMAAAFAAGLAGLLRSQNPDWSANLARAQIINTTDNIDSLNPGYAGMLGSGRINAQKAVTTAAAPQLELISYTVNGVTGGTPAQGSTVNLFVTIRNTWGKVENAVGTLNTSDPYVTITNASSPFGSVDAYATSVNSSPFVFSISASTPFAHPISFSITVNGAGGVSIVLPLTITTQVGTLPVSGVISTDTTWTNDKTYLVTGNVLVNSGITLTIQPGTVVKFNPGVQLLVGGALIADGAPDQEIVFTSAQPAPAAGDWEIIKFLDSAADAVVDVNQDYVSGSILRYARIEYGRGIWLVDAFPYFSHATFYRNTGTGDNAYGPFSALYWSRANISYGALVVRDSKFIENQDQGFAAFSTSGGLKPVHFEIVNNQFIENGGVAISLGQDVGGSRIGSNLIKDNGSGIYFSEGIGTEITDNYISGSKQPAWGPGFAVDMYAGSPIISHNVFANNGQGQANCNSRCAVLSVSSGQATVTSNTFSSNWLDTLFYFDGYDAGTTFQHNNWAGNRVNYLFYRSTSSTQDMTATQNYWGTTDTTIIDNLIYDFWDDFNLGQVLYQPFLTAPDPSAPAFLWNASVNPDPVGIQLATFNLTFSRDMDQSINPAVTFGAAPPYTDYVIADNAQWLDSTHWRATFDFTSLVPRSTYTLSVSSARGTDGMEIPADTRFSFVMDYVGQIADQTPPHLPWVTCTGNPADASYVEASWIARDPDSPITSYRYAIGSAPGTTDIVNWTTTTTTSISRSGLGLVADREYWIAVQARNAGGLWSNSTYSSFIAGQQSQKIYIFLPLQFKN